MLGLDSVLLRVLEVYFGEFLESINKEQLKVGVLKGRVVLRNLRLRKGIRILPGDVPVVTRDGSIAELSLKVPWAKLGSEAVVLRVAGIRIELEPCAEDPGRDAAARKRAQERKLGRLEAAEIVALQLEASNTELEQQQSQQNQQHNQEIQLQDTESPSPTIESLGSRTKSATKDSNNDDEDGSDGRDTDPGFQNEDEDTDKEDNGNEQASDTSSSVAEIAHVNINEARMPTTTANDASAVIPEALGVRAQKLVEQEDALHGSSQPQKALGSRSRLFFRRKSTTSSHEGGNEDQHAKSKEGSRKHKKKTFRAKLLQRIFANLQVHIEDLHVAYIDEVTVPAPGERCEFRVQELHLGTVDAHGRPTFHTPGSSQGILGEVVSRALYAKSVSFHVQNNVIFGPCDWSVHILQCKDEVASARLGAKISAKVQVESLPCSVSAPNVQSLLSLARPFTARQEVLFLLAKRQARPTQTPKQNPRAWWTYACSMVRSALPAQPKKFNVVHAFKCRSQYITLYQEKLEFLESERTVPAELSQELQVLELELDADSVLLFRLFALRERHLSLKVGGEDSFSEPSPRENSNPSTLQELEPSRTEISQGQPGPPQLAGASTGAVESSPALNNTLQQDISKKSAKRSFRLSSSFKRSLKVVTRSLSKSSSNKGFDTTPSPREALEREQYNTHEFYGHDHRAKSKNFASKGVFVWPTCAQQILYEEITSDSLNDPSFAAFRTGWVRKGVSANSIKDLQALLRIGHFQIELFEDVLREQPCTVLTGASLNLEASTSSETMSKQISFGLSQFHIMSSWDGGMCLQLDHLHDLDDFHAYCDDTFARIAAIQSEANHHVQAKSKSSRRRSSHRRLSGGSLQSILRAATGGGGGGNPSSGPEGFGGAMSSGSFYASAQDSSDEPPSPPSGDTLFGAAIDPLPAFGTSFSSAKSLMTFYQSPEKVKGEVRIPHTQFHVQAQLMEWLRKALTAPHDTDQTRALMRAATKRVRANTNAGTQSSSLRAPSKEISLDLDIPHLKILFYSLDVNKHAMQTSLTKGNTPSWIVMVLLQGLKIQSENKQQTLVDRSEEIETPTPVSPGTSGLSPHQMNLSSFQIFTNGTTNHQTVLLQIKNLHVPMDQATGISFTFEHPHVVLSPTSIKAIDSVRQILMGTGGSSKHHAHAQDFTPDQKQTMYSKTDMRNDWPVKVNIGSFSFKLEDEKHECLIDFSMDDFYFEWCSKSKNISVSIANAALLDVQANGDGEFATILHLPEGCHLKYTTSPKLLDFDCLRLFLAWNHTLPGRLVQFRDQALAGREETKMLQSSAPELTHVEQKDSLGNDWKDDERKSLKSSKTSLGLNIGIQELIVELREEALERGLLRLTGQTIIQRDPGQKVMHIIIPQPHLQSAMQPENLEVDLWRPYRPEGSVDMSDSDYTGVIECFIWAPEGSRIHIRNIEIMHFHAEFKELVDYVEYGLSKPLNQLKSLRHKQARVESIGHSSRKAKSHHKAGQPKPPFSIIFHNCVMTLSASRCVEQYAEKRAQLELRSSSCAFVLDRTQSPTQIFDITMEDFGMGTMDLSEGGQFDAILAKDMHRTVKCRWTRSKFTDEEAKFRRMLFVKGIDGIRSWFGNPSGQGFRNHLMWDLGTDPLVLNLSHRQYCLFNIVLSENLTDWRSQPHVCNNLDSKVASTCFCKHLATEEQILETQHTYRFPPSTEFHLRYTDSLFYVYSIRLQNLTYQITDHLRYGRHTKFDMASLTIFLRRAEANAPFFELLKLPGTIVNIERDKSRETSMTVEVTDKVFALADRGGLQQLFFFFEGDQAERQRLGIPVEYGFDPLIHRRAKNTSRFFNLPNLKLRLCTEEDPYAMLLEASLQTRTGKTAQQLRSTEITFIVQSGHFPVMKCWNLLESPVKIHFHATKIAEGDQFQRRINVSVSEIQLLLPLHALHMLKTTWGDWAKNIYTAGMGQLRITKRSHYQRHAIPHTLAQGVFQLDGLQVLTVDDSNPEAGASPLVAIVSSPMVIREVVETLAVSGRRIATYEGDFTDVVASGNSIINDHLWCNSKVRQGITLAYYNLSIAKWEPLVEPWSWEWTLQRTSNAVQKVPTVIAFQLQGPKFLLANISLQALRSLFWLMACAKNPKFTEKFYQLGSTSDGRVLSQHALTIENQSGMTMIVQGQDARGVRRVKDRETISIDHEVHRLSLDWIESESDLSPWYCLEGIPVRTVGAFVFILYPREQPEDHAGDQESSMATRVCIDVRAQGARMHVRVSSVFEIRNESVYSMDLLLVPTMDPITQHQSNRSARLIEGLQPGKGMHIPINASMCTLTLKPQRGALDWWEGIELGTVEALTGKAKRSYYTEVRCEELQDLSSPSGSQDPSTSASTSTGVFAACLAIKPWQSSNRIRQRHLYTMTLTSNVTVVNLLSVDLQFAIQGGEAVTPDRIQIESVAAGAQGGIYGWPVIAKNRLLRLRIDNTQWSTTQFKIDEPITEPQSVVVLDDSGKQVRLMYEIRRPGGSRAIISVFSKAWFLNRTGLSLSFKSGNIHLLESATRALELGDRGQRRPSILSLGSVYRHGEAIHVRSSAGWLPGIIYQVNQARKTYDILFNSGELELDVPASRIRASNTTDQIGPESAQDGIWDNDALTDDGEDEEEEEEEDNDSTEDQADIQRPVDTIRKKAPSYNNEESTPRSVSSTTSRNGDEDTASEDESNSESDATVDNARNLQEGPLSRSGETNKIRGEMRLSTSGQTSQHFQESKPYQELLHGEDKSGLGGVMLFSESSTISLRIAQSMWSSPFSLDSVGTQGSIQLPINMQRESMGNSWCQEIGVQVGLAPSKFRRTKIVTFVPRFLVINELDVDVIVSQSSSNSLGTPIEATRLSVESGREKSLSILRRKGSEAIYLCMTVKNSASNQEFTWSAAFNPAVERTTAIKVRNLSSGHILVVSLQVVARGACHVIRLASADSLSDELVYRIENASSQLVHFFQDVGQPVLDEQGAAYYAAARLEQESAQAAAQAEAGRENVLAQRAFKKLERLDAHQRGTVHRLFPGEAASFGWDTINVQELLVVLSFCGDTQFFTCSFDDLNQEAHLQFAGGATLVATTYFDGRSKVLRLIDEDKLDAYNRSTGSAILPRGVQPSEPRNSLMIQICLAGVGFSMVDARPEEVAYITAAGVGIDVMQHPNADQTVEVVITHLQVDNQLLQARLPIVMAPVPRSLGLMTENAANADPETVPPFLHFSVVERKALGSHESRYLEYVGLSLAEFTITVEMIWALRMARFASEISTLRQTSMELALFYQGQGRGQVAFTDHDSVHDSAALDRWIREQNQALLNPSVDTSVDVDNIEGQAFVIETDPTGGRRALDQHEDSAEEQRTTKIHSKERGSEIREQRPGLGLEKSSTSFRTRRKTWYIEWLEMHPIKAQLNLQNLVEDPLPRLQFTGVQAGPAGGKSPSFDAQGLIAALPIGLFDVENATIFLSAMFLHNVLLTGAQVKSRITRHFTSQALSQLYRVIFASELLGNPIGLVSNLGTGLRDLFYEPAQGIVQSPEAFGAGLARGTTSFVHRTAVGTFDSVSKLSTSISSGVALLSMDPRYLMARRAALIDERPRNLGDGFLLGAKSLGLGLSNGITGIVTEPIRGAEEEGVEGFFKGVGIGLLGIAIKPTVGALDMIGRFLAGIKSTASLLDMSEKPSRQRLPRVMHGHIKQIKVYDSSAAFVQSLMASVWGEGASDYFHHLPLPGNLLLVTAGYGVGCIDYSSFVIKEGNSAGHVSTPGSPGGEDRKAVLLWRVDTRMILGMVQTEGQDNSSSLLVRVSDQYGISFVSGALVNVRVSNQVSELVLRGKRSTLEAIQGELAKAMSVQLSELRVEGRPERAEFGITLSPVPNTQTHAAALHAVREFGSHLGIGLVTRVMRGSLAHQLEIEPGDYLVALGGSSLSADEYGDALADAVADLPSPSALEIVLWRRGRWLFKRIPL